MNYEPPIEPPHMTMQGEIDELKAELAAANEQLKHAKTYEADAILFRAERDKAIKRAEKAERELSDVRSDLTTDHLPTDLLRAEMAGMRHRHELEIAAAKIIIDDLKAKMAKAEAVISKLPETADGVPAVAGDDCLRCLVWWFWLVEKWNNRRINSPVVR